MELSVYDLNSFTATIFFNQEECEVLFDNFNVLRQTKQPIWIIMVGNWYDSITFSGRLNPDPNRITPGYKVYKCQYPRTPYVNFSLSANFAAGFFNFPQDLIGKRYAADTVKDAATHRITFYNADVRPLGLVKSRSIRRNQPPRPVSRSSQTIQQRPAIQQVSRLDGERELMSGPLSPTVNFRLLIRGNAGPSEIDVLIKKLEIEKEILSEE